MYFIYSHIFSITILNAKCVDAKAYLLTRIKLLPVGNLHEFYKHENSGLIFYDNDKWSLTRSPL